MYQFLDNASYILLKEGKYEWSLNLYKYVLSALELEYSEEHPLTGLVSHNIGIIHMHLKVYSSAVTAFQNAVKLKRHAFGKDHPFVANSLVKFGIAHLLNREHDLAYFHLNSALKLRSKTLGYLQPSNAIIYNNIGCIHLHRKEMKPAQDAFEKALEVQRFALKGNKEKN